MCHWWQKSQRYALRLGAIQRPRELRGALRFTFGAVRILRRPSRVKCEETRPWVAVSRADGDATFHGPQGYGDVGTFEGVSIQAQTEVVVHSTTELDEGDHERFTHSCSRAIRQRTASSSLEELRRRRDGERDAGTGTVRQGVGAGKRSGRSTPCVPRVKRLLSRWAGRCRG